MLAIRLITLALMFSAALFAAKDTTYDGPCEPISSFVKSRQPSAGGDKALSLGFGQCSLPEKARLNFLIATVPNPIDTHLALWFDRSVESIVNAADSVGFRFQGAWVPWDADLVRAETDPFKRKEVEAEHDYRKKQPGVLLFRSRATCPQDASKAKQCQYSDLAVLLVPETPTGGIVPDVFNDATRIISQFNSSTSQIPVMGPSFSGSFDSLAKIMRASRDQLGSRLQVISGTAETPDAWKAAFQNSESRYMTTVHDRETRLQMLKDHLGSPNLAILTESETHLEADKPGGGTVRTFRYPREISRLRNAYGDEVLRTVVGAQQQPTSFRNLLGFRLYDVGFGTDSTPLLATNQTPLSQDAVLLEIGRSLQRERIEAAGILATDVYDALFIARYLRDTCPDVRIFTFDPDLLYERAAEDFSMDGILALGTYPLIASNQTWTDLPTSPQSTPLTVFPSQRAEGVYNATRALLIDNSFVSKDYKDEPLAEYSAPVDCSASGSPKLSGCSNPPIWLLAVTRTGYWPLAVRATANEPPLLAWPSNAKGNTLSIDPLPRLWQLLFVIISVAVAWYFAEHFSMVLTRGVKAGFSRLNIWPHQEGWLARLCYLQICSLSLVAMYLLFVAPLLAASAAGFGPDARWPVPMAWLLLCWFAILAAAPVIVLRRPIVTVFRRRAAPERANETGEPPRPPGLSVFPKWPESWNFAILGLAWVFAGIFVWALLKLFVLPLYSGSAEYKDQEGFFFVFRSLHLSSGVSPLAPLRILLLAHFLWGVVHLRRVRLLQERLIDVPTLDGDLVNNTGQAAALESTRVAIDVRVNEPAPLHLRTFLMFGLVLAINLYITHAVRSFEYWPFDWVFLLILSLLYALLFLTWTRFLMIWSQFRVFLEALERQPFRSAFSRLPKQPVISPLLLSTPTRLEFIMFVGIRERLAKLKLQGASNWIAEIDRLDKEIEKVLAMATRGCTVSRADARHLREQLHKVNKILVSGFNEAGRTAKALPGRSSNRLREEVIALQYVDYIQYILHQQRNLLLFSISAFVLSIIALHAYPFQAPRTINTFITVVFISFAIGVVMVLISAERDAILSRITKTKSGELSSSFYFKVASYLAVPMVTVLSSQFPSWGRFLFSWVQPLLEAIK